MDDPLQAILKFTAKTSLFPANSRYHGNETAKMETANGRTIIYLRRRFVPPPESFALLQEHTVTQDDRLDNLANRYFGDPEQFWRLCDANAAMRPEELTETTGRRLRITMPEGISGGQNV